MSHLERLLGILNGGRGEVQGQVLHILGFEGKVPGEEDGRWSEMSEPRGQREREVSVDVSIFLTPYLTHSPISSTLPGSTHHVPTLALSPCPHFFLSAISPFFHQSGLAC